MPQYSDGDGLKLSAQPGQKIVVRKKKPGKQKTIVLDRKSKAGKRGGFAVGM